MRGGGTSQAGQAIGDGLIVDTSKYLNRILELNVEERWARVEPGIVLDELNAALEPHGLRFAPDISTASRATVGGMMANNSSGARSVLYGKTIDHVLEQHVVLSDGSVAHFRALDAGRARRAVCRATALEAALLPRSAAARRRLRRTKSPAAFRRSCGGSAATTSMPSSTRRRPFDLTRLMVGSEGTLGVVLDATLSLVPLPKAKAVLAIQFADLLDALAATPAILAHGPSAVEVMDRFILDNTKQSAALHRLRQTFIDGDPGALLCVEFYADRGDDLPPRLDALEADLRGRGVRLSLPPRPRPAGAGAHLEPARSRARPVDGHEGRRQVAVVRRGHGGRAGAAARLHRAVPRHRPRGTARRPASTRTPRSAACTCAPSST